MLHIDECATCSIVGRTAIECPFCKGLCFNPKAHDEDGIPRLEWFCVHCHAKFTSNPPYEAPGETPESLKEKIILKLLEVGICEKVVRIYATSSKKPPVFLEDELRKMLGEV